MRPPPPPSRSTWGVRDPRLTNAPNEWRASPSLALRTATGGRFSYGDPRERRRSLLGRASRISIGTRPAVIGLPTSGTAQHASFVRKPACADRLHGPRCGRPSRLLRRAPAALGNRRRPRRREIAQAAAGKTDHAPTFPSSAPRRGRRRPGGLPAPTDPDGEMAASRPRFDLSWTGQQTRARMHLSCCNAPPRAGAFSGKRCPNARGRGSRF